MFSNSANIFVLVIFCLYFVVGGEVGLVIQYEFCFLVLVMLEEIFLITVSDLK